MTNHLLPKIQLITLGGTIAMTHQDKDQGIAPSLAAEDLIKSFDTQCMAVDIQAQSLLQLPGPSLGFTEALQVIRVADQAVAAGAAAVIVTQGTDSLEETAFLWDLLWPHPQPLIVTGAMRNPESLSADGPANLAAALNVALSAASRQRGVLVVMNDTIHSARQVRKAHASALEAFVSSRAAVGALVEGEVVYFENAASRVVLPMPYRQEQSVLLWQQSLGESPRTLAAALDTVDGAVFAAFGSGHVSAAVVDVVSAASARMPIVITTRTLSGATTTHTYGYRGAEVELQAAGALMAGFLPPLKARLLLWVLLGQKNIDKQSMAQTLAQFKIG